MRYLYSALGIVIHCFFLNLSNAGGYPGVIPATPPIGVMPVPTHVGGCNIYPALTAPFVRSIDIYDNFHYIAQAKTAYGPLPPAGPFVIIRDPSQQVFGSLPSVIPGEFIFIDWYGNLVSFNKITGARFQIGNCILHPGFVSAYLHPAPPPPMPKSGAVTFNCNLPGQNCNFAVPNILINLANEFNPTLIANEKIAKQCKSSAVKGDVDGFYECMVPKMMGKKEQEYYACMQIKDDNQAALCALKKGVGQNEQKYIEVAEQCYKNHANNYSEWPACVANSNLVGDPKLQRALSCISSSSQQSGQIDFMGAGVCFVGNQLDMNNESLIITKCAVATKGQPHAFATCAGGELMIAEVDKCLKDGIGGSGCFGEGNTIMQYRQKVADELEKQFGKGHPIVAYWNIMTDSPGQTRKVIDEVNKGLKALQSAGGGVIRAGQTILDGAKDEANGILKPLGVKL